MGATRERVLMEVGKSEAQRPPDSLQLPSPGLKVRPFREGEGGGAIESGSGVVSWMIGDKAVV